MSLNPFVTMLSTTASLTRLNRSELNVTPPGIFPSTVVIENGSTGATSALPSFCAILGCHFARDECVPAQHSVRPALFRAAIEYQHCCLSVIVNRVVDFSVGQQFNFDGTHFGVCADNDSRR